MKLEEIINRNSDLSNSKKLDLPGVSSINSSGSFDIEFIQSDLGVGFALALSDNKELLDNIDFISCDGELNIKTKGNITIITNSGTQVICTNNFLGNGIQINGMNITIDNRNQINNFNTLNGRFKIVVVLPRLNYIKLSGTGSFFCNDFQQDFLELRLSGSGNINFSGTVQKVDAKVSGTGTINLKNLVSNTATLKLSGVGTIKANVTQSVTAKVSGVGDIKIYGNPTDRNTSKSGLGKIKFK